ncbi:MAG: thiamine diphosphokinase [Clostridiales bacterium]
MKKTCMVVLGGAIKDMALFRQRLNEADQLFIADSGARHLLNLGIMPQQVYGDLDSLTAAEIKHLEEGGCRFRRVAAEKNDTDSSLVLKEALEQGYEDIRVWGALGGRPDHSYANIMLLQLVFEPEFHQRYGGLETARPAVILEDGDVRIFLPQRGQWIDGEKGDYLSFFALTPEVTGFKNIGLKYQPQGGRYVSTFPLGISNELMADKAWISWDEGRLLAMWIRRGENNDELY